MGSLYHYTCTDHGLPGIRAASRLRPRRPVPFLESPPVIWLTDLDRIDDPGALGLQSSIISCDRTAVRFTVHPRHAVPWRDFTVIHHLNPVTVAHLELDRTPEHWWVTCEVLRVGEPDYIRLGSRR